MTPQRRIAKAFKLSLLTVALAGCATSKFPGAKQDRFGLPPIEDARMVNAPIADPPNILPRTHLAAGRLFEQQGMLARAIAQYRKAIAVNHDYPAAYHRLGLALSRANRHEPALAALRKAVALSPEDAVLHNDLGFELMYPKKWHEAESHFRKAIELNRNLTRAYVNLGLALSKQGRFDDALVAFKDVLPEADAYYNLGLMYRAHQRYNQAEEAFSHALAIAPEFNAARVQLDKLAARSDADQEPALVQATPNGRQAGEPEAATDRVPTQQASPPAVVSIADSRAEPEQSERIVTSAAIVEPAVQAPATPAVQNVVTDAEAAEREVVSAVYGTDRVPDTADAAEAYASTEPACPETAATLEATAEPAGRGRTEDAWAAWRERWNALAEDLAWVRDEIACLDAVDVEHDPLAEADRASFPELDVSSAGEPLPVSDPLEETKTEHASPQSDARRHEWKLSPSRSEPDGGADILDHVLFELHDLASFARNEMRFAQAGQEEQKFVGPPARTGEARRNPAGEPANASPRPADLGPLPH